MKNDGTLSRVAAELRRILRALPQAPPPCVGGYRALFSLPARSPIIVPDNVALTPACRVTLDAQVVNSASESMDVTVTPRVRTNLSF